MACVRVLFETDVGSGLDLRANLAIWIPVHIVTRADWWAYDSSENCDYKTLKVKWYIYLPKFAYLLK